MKQTNEEELSDHLYGWIRREMSNFFDIIIDEHHLRMVIQKSVKDGRRILRSIYSNLSNETIHEIAVQIYKQDGSLNSIEQVLRAWLHN